MMKNSIKRIISIVMIATLLFSLAACSKAEDKKEQTVEPTVTETLVANEQPADEPGDEVLDGPGSVVEGEEPDAFPEVGYVESTLGSVYLDAFSESTENDALSIVQDLMAADTLGLELVPMEVFPGYLTGFSDSIDGFSKGFMFSPIIGSIPFVGYVFESITPEDLLKNLEVCADPRWNICTEADEMVSSVKDNFVFFLMCSNDEF